MIENIDKYLDAIADSIDNPKKGITISGYMVQLDAIDKLKRLIVEGIAVSSKPDPNGFLDIMYRETEKLIKRKKDVDELVNELKQNQDQGFENTVINADITAAAKCLLFKFAGIDINQNKSIILVRHKRLSEMFQTIKNKQPKDYSPQMANPIKEKTNIILSIAEKYLTQQQTKELKNFIELLS